MYCLASSPTVTGCTFVSNTGGGGGGISCADGSEPVISHCTFWDNSAGYGSGILSRGGSAPTIWNSIIAFGTNGVAVFCHSDSRVHIYCSDIFGNEGGDWVGCVAGQLGVGGNLSADPLFCDPGAGDLHLSDASPCLDADGCGQIGAWGGGCSAPTAVGEEKQPSTTWSAVKHMYR
jgi:hypothetical protein